MSSAVKEQVIYRIANAPIWEYPYPHFYLEQVFPQGFYAELRANWPDSSALVSLPETGRVSKGVYKERFVLPLNEKGINKLSEDRRAFWTEFGGWFLAPPFLGAMVNKFDRYVQERLGNEAYQYKFEADALVVRDHTHYSIGPHTDAPHRLLSLLFYCPDDESMKQLGTSIYVPLDPDFRCKGGLHHKHAKFQKVRTLEYKPNSLFAFFKTDNSFHGVEPIGEQNVERDVLLYDIRIQKSEIETPARTTGVGLKMLQNLLRRK